MQGIAPVTRTYNTLMIACNTSNQWLESLQIYEHMKQAGLQPNTTTYNALISAYSKAGRLEKVSHFPLVSPCDQFMHNQDFRR